MTALRSLEGRVALVTGASRGFGEATARALAKDGAHIIAVARTVGALEALDDAIQAEGGSATLVPFDLIEFDAIDRLGAALYERFGRLDILVGNAAILGGLSPLGHAELKIAERLFAVNVMANWRLIRAMDPLLRQSDAGRAVFVTCEAAQALRPYWGVYATSKTALETMVLTYAAEVASTSIRVNLLDPGPMRTALRRAAYPGEDAKGNPEPALRAPAAVMMASPTFLQNGQRLRADALTDAASVGAS